MKTGYRLHRLKALKPAPSKFRNLPPIKFHNLPIAEAFREGETAETLEDPEVMEAWERMGKKSSDYRLAIRVIGMKRTKFPNAPLTELITYDWLHRTKVNFTYQGTLFGGRAFRGGILPDFVVQSGGSASAWQVQGEYWHSQKINQGKDTVTNQLLLGQVVDGVRITKVVQVWENDIYHKRPQVFNLALAGVGLRG